MGQYGTLFCPSSDGRTGFFDVARDVYHPCSVWRHTTRVCLYRRMFACLSFFSRDEQPSCEPSDLIGRCPWADLICSRKGLRDSWIAVERTVVCAVVFNFLIRR